MITRCKDLTDHPLRKKRSASQSSSRGCVGFFPVAPKLLGLPAIALPKCHCQMRLTITRAVSVLSGLAIQFTKAVRRPERRRASTSEDIFPWSLLDIEMTLK